MERTIVGFLNFHKFKNNIKRLIVIYNELCWVIWCISYSQKTVKLLTTKASNLTQNTNLSHKQKKMYQNNGY